MNFKTTYVLFGLVALMFVVLAVAFWMEPAPTDASLWVLPSVHASAKPLQTSDIDRVEIEREKPTKETIVFVRDSGDKQRWRITEPRGLRADRFAVENLIRQIFDAQRDENADRPDSLKSWGLEPPAAKITLKKGDERTVQLNVGNTSPGGEASAVIYVTSSDRPKEGMAVKKSTLDAVLKGLNDFRDRDVLAANAGDVQSLKLTADKKTVALTKNAEGRWRFADPAGYGAAESEGDVAGAADPAKAPHGMRDLLNILTGLRVDYKDDKDNDFVEDDAKDLAKYGLDDGNPGLLRVEIERVDSIEHEGGKADKKTSKVVLLVGNKVEDKKAEEKKADDKKPDDKKAEEKKAEEKVYARLEGEKNVVKLSAKPFLGVRELLKDPSVLRDRNLVVFPNFAKPDAINVKNESGLLEFRRSEAFKPWELYRGNEPAQKVDDQALTGPKGLVTLLTQKRNINSFPENPKEADLGLDKPAAVVSLWVDGLVKDEPKPKEKDKEKEKEKEKEKKEAKPKLKDEAKPTVRLSFGKREGDYVVVKREMGDEVTFVKVPYLLLDAAKEGALAYLSKDLPPFNEGTMDPTIDVTKLELLRNGTTYVITRDTTKENAPWKIEQPADLAGRTADAMQVRFLLNNLNNLRATRLIAEKATEAQLDKEYGLKNPETKAVVTVTRKNEKPQTFEYLFGKELEDKISFYAKQGQRDVIAAVDKAIVAPLKDTELLDLGVFSFDVAKVKSVKLTGWQKVVGGQFVLELERKDASQWTVKAPKDFTIDAGKVRALLDALAHLRAERFISHKSEPKADQELKVADGALVIEVTVEGEEKPFQLTIGKLDAEKSFFATSNRLPGDVFEVSRLPFEGPKTKPAYFNP
jgi:hypothetical protein